MNLTKIKSDIPKEVVEWANNNAAPSRKFVCFLLFRYGECVERTFATRMQGKKLLLTEVRRRATGDNKTIVKNIYFTRMGGYSAVFEKKDKTNNSYGFGTVVFPKEDFDKWFTVDELFLFQGVYVNPEVIRKIDEFKYCGYSGDGDIIEYLNQYREHPTVEFFGKLGISLAASLVSQAEKDKQFRHFIFKNVEDIKTFGPQATLYAYRHSMSIEKASVKLQAKRRVANEIPASKGKALDCEKLLAYMKSNGIGYRTYNDYLESVIGLELDLSDTKNIYPANFKAMHDLRISEYESKRAKLDREQRKELYQGFAKAGKKASVYEFTSGNYSIIAPRDISELVIEGKILGHCVGQMGYDKRMADGQIYIMFVRKKDDIKTPFVTIEYDIKSRRIKQAYGQKNTTPPIEVTIFLNEWLEVVKRLNNQNRRKTNG